MLIHSPRETSIPVPARLPFIAVLLVTAARAPTAELAGERLQERLTELPDVIQEAQPALGTIADLIKEPLREMLGDKAQRACEHAERELDKGRHRRFLCELMESFR